MTTEALLYFKNAATSLEPEIYVNIFSEYRVTIESPTSVDIYGDDEKDEVIFITIEKGTSPAQYYPEDYQKIMAYSEDGSGFLITSYSWDFLKKFLKVLNKHFEFAIFNNWLIQFSVDEILALQSREDFVNKKI